MSQVTDTAARDTGSAGRRRRMMFTALPVAAFGVLAVVLAIGLGSGDPSRVPSALIGKKVPDFQLAAIEGLKLEGNTVPGLGAAALRQGKVSIVNVWASWCGPCRVEHPYLMQLAARGDVQMTGINYKDSPENARRFLGLHGNPFSVVGADGNGRTAVDWGVYGVPETFVVDGKGTIRYKHVGPISETALKTKILPAIEAAR